jgi:hydrophobe/amphiphile efflux-3 (HAE3) family protein
VRTRDLLARIAGRAVERPTPVIVIAVLLTLIGAVAALRLQPDRSPSSLVDRGSATYAATQGFYRSFGDEPVEVLVQGDLRQVLEPANLGRLLALESCLSGRAPGGRVIGGQAAPAPCAAIARLNPSAVVFGPATFLNQLAIQANELLGQESRATLARAQGEAARAARKARKEGLAPAVQRQVASAAGQRVLARFQRRLLELGLRYGQVGLPRLDDPNFVTSVICERGEKGCVPKPRLAAIAPSSKAALISARLRPGLGDAQRQEAISLFRQAVADPAFRLGGGPGEARRASPSYVVSGVPVVFAGLAQELSTQIFVLLAAALAVMVITLALVFRSPLRLLPLGIALCASGLTFGFLSLAGGSLTMASIAVLPVLIGLSVDYAIQFQARFLERARAGSSPPRAAVEAAANGGPVIATAVLATMAGFLVLVLSPIPMVRGFALLLVVGIAIAFALALTVGLSVLSLLPNTHRRLRAEPPGPGSSARGHQHAGTGTPSLARTRRALGRVLWPVVDPVRRSSRAAGSRARAGARRALAFSIAAPGRVLLAAALLAIVGWVVGTRIPVISDVRELVPRDLPALEEVDKLEQATGISGLTYVTVTAPDLADPRVISWMHGFEQRVLRRHGFSGEHPSCHSKQARICPEISLSDFLYGERRRAPGKHRIKAALNLLPDYISQALVSPDSATGKPGSTGVITFGIPVMPLDRQKRLIDDVRAQIDPPGPGNGPPPGVTARVLGLPALAADANSSLSDSRYLVTIVGLLAIAAVLAAVYRSASRALIPMVPIVLATGWSSLVLWATTVPLNPMSATLGALVVAIATEFSVLLSARFHEERRRGGPIGEALRRAYARTGTAVLASGITAIAGFAVLMLSDIRMLRDFGLVTVLDLAAALAGVLIVLPAALVWSEGGADRLAAAVARLRRRGRPAAADAR